jgi:hypothetical protein
VHLLPFNPVRPLELWSVLFSVYAYYSLFVLYCIYAVVGFRLLATEISDGGARQILWGLLALALPIVGGCALILLHKNASRVRGRSLLVAIGLVAAAIIGGYVCVQASHAIAPQPPT